MIESVTTRTRPQDARVGADRPDEPLCRIRPAGWWSPLNLHELWRHRELLYFLTWRDVKVRYRQAALGVAWAVLQPLFTMIVFTLLFGRLAGLNRQTGDVPYALFVVAGLLPWTFFANAVTSSGNSLVGSANMISKVYFPRMFVPAAAVAAGLVDLLIGGGLLVAVMAWYGVAPGWQLLLLPVPLALLTLLALGVGLWFAALNVRFRDVRHALPFCIQLWLFLSPVIYPPTFVPDRFRWLLQLNPLTGVIETLRSCLLGTAMPWGSLGIAAAVTLAVLTFSALDFRRMETSFADVV